jgi:hypothetical protein
MSLGRKKVFITVGSTEVMDKYPANGNQTLHLFEPVPHGAHNFNFTLFATIPIDFSFSFAPRFVRQSVRVMVPSVLCVLDDHSSWLPLAGKVHIDLHPGRSD